MAEGLGRFGIHGGQYIPETLMSAVTELDEAYNHYKDDPDFRRELCTWARDMERQALNVYRMRLLGAQVHGVETGTAVLKDAVSETFREGTRRIADTHYVIGSCTPARIPPRARCRPHSAQLHVFLQPNR